MLEPVNAPDEINDSRTPAIFTYLGQFINHDITAQTDRDGKVTKLDPIKKIKPQKPDDVVAGLANGRRPQLDLDSVYADGPGLISNDFANLNQSVAETFGIFDPGNLRLRLQEVSPGPPRKIDLPRDPTSKAAQIADMRNDENLIVGQLHAAFLACHNAVADRLPGSVQNRYVRGRQLVRWAYQYIVVNEYLRHICAPEIVDDVLANGPRYFGPMAGRERIFMPLEFSVAAFRFGHSMIRPKYRLNGQTERRIDQIFFPASNSSNMDSGGHLKESLLVEWDRFAPGGQRLQFARKFDHLLSRGAGQP